ASGHSGNSVFAVGLAVRKRQVLRQDVIANHGAAVATVRIDFDTYAGGELAPQIVEFVSADHAVVRDPGIIQPRWRITGRVAQLSAGHVGESAVGWGPCPR